MIPLQKPKPHELDSLTPEEAKLVYPGAVENLPYSDEAISIAFGRYAIAADGILWWVVYWDKTRNQFFRCMYWDSSDNSWIKP